LKREVTADSVLKKAEVKYKSFLLPELVAHPLFPKAKLFQYTCPCRFKNGGAIRRKTFPSPRYLIVSGVPQKYVPVL
jgi:hypothetical protein